MNTRISITYTALILNATSEDPLNNEFFDLSNRLVFNSICAEHHLLSMFSLLLVIVMHYNKRLSSDHSLADFFRVLKSYSEIDLISGDPSPTAETNHCHA